MSLRQICQTFRCALIALACVLASLSLAQGIKPNVTVKAKIAEAMARTRLNKHARVLPDVYDARSDHGRASFFLFVVAAQSGFAHIFTLTFRRGSP